MRYIDEDKINNEICTVIKESYLRVSIYIIDF